MRNAFHLRLKAPSLDINPFKNVSARYPARFFFLTGFSIAAGYKRAPIKTSETLFQAALNPPILPTFTTESGFLPDSSLSSPPANCKFDANGLRA